MIIILKIFFIYFSLTMINAFYKDEKIYTGCFKKGLLTLTYDDGPGAYTNPILDALKEFNVKATFFVTGKLIGSEKSIKTIQRIIDEGHIVGSHMFSHKHLQYSNLSVDQVIEEMNKTSDVLYKHFGFRPRYMRAPYGSMTKHAYETIVKLGYKIFFWNFLTRDWVNKNSDLLFKNLTILLDNPSLSYLKNGLIVLQHDTQKITLDIQHRLIEYFFKKNFKIVPLYECINETIDRISFKDSNEVSNQFVTLYDTNNLGIFFFIIVCSIFTIVVFLKRFNKN